MNLSMSFYGRKIGMATLQVGPRVAGELQGMGNPRLKKKRMHKAATRRVERM